MEELAEILTRLTKISFKTVEFCLRVNNCNTE